MGYTLAREQRSFAQQAWRWIDDRLGLSEFTYPVPAHANNVLYTLGGITFFGIVILIVTGIYLTQYYNSSPDEARQSVLYIINQARFGDFVRSVHFWLASLVTITLLMHAVRVFVTGAYRPPREGNWIIGLGLLGTMLGLVFTGTVLKWDQEGWEALQHNEEIGKLLGGAGVWFTSGFTSSTPILQRLFIAHVAILPFLLLTIAAAHFFLIKHHGISSMPGHEEARPRGETDTQAAMRSEGYVPFTGHLVHIVGFGILLSALAALLALVSAAPLGSVIEPGEEKTKPPWMFLPLYPFEDWLGIKALLYMPIVGFVALALVPFVDRWRSSSFRRRWPLLLAGALVIVALVALALYALASTPAEHIPGMGGE